MTRQTRGRGGGGGGGSSTMMLNADEAQAERDKNTLLPLANPALVHSELRETVLSQPHA